MHVLVTGGGGFLGTYIVKELLANEYKVTNISRNSYPHLLELGVDTIKCDLSSKEELDTHDLSTFDAIIHTAALAGVWGNYDKYFNANFTGTENILEKALKSNISYFIYTSSPSVVFGKEDIINGDESIAYPKKYYTSYAKTKALAEKLVLSKNSDDLITAALRPHLIWGPGDPHLFPRILQSARENKLKMVGDGENMVDIIYVENAAIAHVKLLKGMIEGKDVKGKAYFIGQEKPVNIWGFIDQIISLNKIRPIESSLSFNKAFYIGWFLELIYKFLGILSPEPPMTRFVALQLAKNHYFSHERAFKDFSYVPKISTEKGLEITMNSKIDITKPHS